MKNIGVAAAAVLLIAGLALALPSDDPIPTPAQPIEKAVELARQEVGRTDTNAADYLLMVAFYERPSGFARHVTESGEKKAVNSLTPDEYAWFMELRHPVNNDQSYTLIVKRDGKVEILWQTE